MHPFLPRIIFQTLAAEEEMCFSGAKKSDRIKG